MGLSIDGSEQIYPKPDKNQKKLKKEITNEPKIIFAQSTKNDESTTWKGVSFSGVPSDPPKPDDTPNTPTAGDPPIPGGDEFPTDPPKPDDTPNTPTAGDPPIPGDDEFPTDPPEPDDTPSTPTAGDPPIPDVVLPTWPPGPDETPSTPTAGDPPIPDDNETETATDIVQLQSTQDGRSLKKVLKSGDRIPDGYKVFSIAGETIQDGIITKTGVYILKKVE